MVNRWRWVIALRALLHVLFLNRAPSAGFREQPVGRVDVPIPNVTIGASASVSAVNDAQLVFQPYHLPELATSAAGCLASTVSRAMTLPSVNVAYSYVIAQTPKPTTPTIPTTPTSPIPVDGFGNVIHEEQQCRDAIHKEGRS